MRVVADLAETGRRSRSGSAVSFRPRRHGSIPQKWGSFMIPQCAGAKTTTPPHDTWLFAMNADPHFISDKNVTPSGYPKSRLKQQLLLDDALEKIEPIIRNGDSENASARFYRIMQKLHSNYPYLNGGELEALLLGLLKKKHSENAL